MPIQNRTKRQEDRFVKSLYYAFGWNDMIHSIMYATDVVDPYIFASWCALQVEVYTVQECLQRWLQMSNEDRDLCQESSMRLAYIAPGCKISGLGL